MLRKEYTKRKIDSPKASSGEGKIIRVLTTDDSALIRLTLNRYLNRFPDIEVVGQANNGREMLALVETALPDVVVLDVEMPVMNGMEALEQLMRFHPLPVVMLSNLTWSGAEVTFQALELGAMDFVAKPQPGTTMAETVDLLVQKIRQTAHAKLQFRPVNKDAQESGRRPKSSDTDSGQRKRISALQPSDMLLAIASSTGGPSALTDFLLALPPGLPLGGVIVQHMPMGFTAILGQRLNRISDYKIVEATNGSRLMRGQFLIAPGGYHLTFDSQGIATLNEGPTINGVRPAADVTFRSLAQHFGAQTTALVLTGMGRDGFAGAMDVCRSGGRILAQDEKSAVVFGMPRRVVESNLAEYVASPEELGAYLAGQVVR